MKKQLIPIVCLIFVAAIFTSRSEAQLKKIRVAIPGYTISMISFLAAKMNGYYTAEGLEVELIATRAPTANLVTESRNVHNYYSIFWMQIRHVLSYSPGSQQKADIFRTLDWHQNGLGSTIIS